MSTSTVRWLLSASWFTVAFGVLLWLTRLPVLGAPAQMFYALTQLDFSLTREVPHEAAFPLGILGAVMVGWGLMLVQATRLLAHKQPEALRQIVLVGMTSWFVLDQLASWRLGAFGNMVTNTPYYLWFVLPLLGSQWRAQTPSAHSHATHTA